MPNSDRYGSTLSSSKSYQISIVQYLCKTGILPQIKEQADKVVSSRNKDVLNHFHLTIPVDVILLADISADLGAEIYSNPYRVETEFRRAISSVVCLSSSSLEVDISLIISSLPPLPQITASCLLNETRPLFQHLATVSAFSTIVKYVRKKVYKCVVCKEDSAVRRGAEAAATPARCIPAKDSLTCKHCGVAMVEDASLRQSGDRIFVRVLPISALKNCIKRFRQQAISLSLTEELCYGLELGKAYNFVLSRDLRVWGYEPLLPYPLRAPSYFPYSINRFISHIRDHVGETPLGLVTAFATQLDQGIYPPSAFLQLKTALLLSISSLAENEAGMSILALGDSSRLMQAALKSCPRLLRTTLSHPQGTTFTEQPYNWTEASSLLLSSRAISYVGDVSRINSPFISQILKAVDSEVVSQVGKEKQSKIALRTAVWAHWHCDKHSSQDVNKLKTLINIFGLPFMGDAPNIEEEELASYILTRAVETDSKFAYIVPENDLRDFLESVSLHKVEMSSMAASLIRNYFVASRQERPESLPIRSIQIMTRMAESSARLNQRNEVIHEDALLAAYLYEESMEALFGPSMYSPPLNRNLWGTDRLLDIVSKMGEVFMEFSLWLDQYIKTLTSLSGSVSEL